MPMPVLPPPSQTPSPTPIEQITNSNDQNQNQSQFVVPNDNNVNVDGSQQQSSNAQTNGLSTSNSSPTVIDNGVMSNTQINSGYGTLAKECMENVGCQDVLSLEILPYLGINNANGLDSDVNSASYGAAFRLLMPLGNGFNGNLNKLAEAEVAKRIGETQLSQFELIKRQVDLDEQIVKSCAFLKNPIDGKVIVIDPTNASPVVSRIYEVCQGLNVVLLGKPPTNNTALEQENMFLRQKIDQLLKTNVPQKIGN